ncbi:hypothetical protein AB0I81_23050 [Nonomuraea sp. NPDC050404]|uniref:hypothetical protein n=1 Tax=Nonomuraea sp. NPDC050404 TaxID=3155783 RepID=UPI00340C3FAE
MSATITFRKTKSGEWVAYGPAELIKPGPVVVSKKDGTTVEEVIERVGAPFDVGGQPMVYGYLAPAACVNCDQPGATHHRRDSSGIPGKVCDRCNREPWYMLSFA